MPSPLRTLRIAAALLLAPAAAAGQLNVAHYLGSGRLDLYKERYTDAVARFTAVINTRPALAEAWHLRGIAKYNLDDFRGALDDYSRAISLNPFYAEAYHYRGVTHEQLGDFSRARRDLLSALELNPANGSIYANMGLIHMMHKEYGKALEYFDESLKLDRTAADAYMNRALAHLGLGDTASAEADLRSSIRLNPFSAESFRRLGAVYYDKGEYRRSLPELREALRLDPGNTLVMFQTALARYELAEYDSAFAVFDQILALEPQNALVLYDRALLYTELGRYNEAEADYTRAMDLAPGNILPHFNRAGVRVETGDLRGAERDLTSAIAIFPDFAAAYANRAAVRSRLGDDRGAFQDRQRAEQLLAAHRGDTARADTTAYAALRDTAADLRRFVGFDSEFGNDLTRRQLKNQRVDVQLRPLYTLRPAAETPLDDFPYVGALFAYNAAQPADAPRLFPALVAAPATDAQPADTTEGQPQGEAAILARATAEAANHDFYNALQILRGARADFATPWLYHFVKGVVEATMADYIHSISQMQAPLALPDAAAHHHAGPAADADALADYSVAENDLRQAIDLNPGFSLAWYNLGNLAVKAQRFQEGVGHYTQALALDDDIAEAYLNRGITLIFLQETDRGCIDISRAGSMGLTDAYNIINRYCKAKRQAE